MGPINKPFLNQNTADCIEMSKIFQSYLSASRPHSEVWVRYMNIIDKYKEIVKEEYELLKID